MNSNFNRDNAMESQKLISFYYLAQDKLYFLAFSVSRWSNMTEFWPTDYS